MKFFTKKRRSELVPGTVIQCESGRYIAFYEHRTDIIANGENELDARRNLRLMYNTVIKFEQSESETPSINIPANYQSKKFTEKINVC